jgi:hypothetical protein
VLRIVLRGVVEPETRSGKGGESMQLQSDITCPKGISSALVSTSRVANHLGCNEAMVRRFAITFMSSGLSSRRQAISVGVSIVSSNGKE